MEGSHGVVELEAKPMGHQPGACDPMWRDQLAILVKKYRSQLVMNRDRHTHVPSVIRSREHLMARGVRFLPGTAVPTTLPIAADGVTYTMAQEASWLDEHHFAVG